MSKVLYLLCELCVARAGEFFRNRLAVLGYGHPNIMRHDCQHLLTERSGLLRELRGCRISHLNQPIDAEFCDLLGAVPAVARRYDKG
jgi:hypothetical protein